MCYLANILTSERYPENKFYNITSDVGKLIPDILTLIIGWDKAKELHPNASILNWKIDENTYWTYGKRVKRDKNERDIKEFDKMVLERAVKGVKYEFFSVITATVEEKRKFFTSLLDSKEKFLLLSNDMVYVYFPEEGRTVGLSLSDIDYEGGDRNSFLSRCFKTETVKTIKERDYITYDTKELIENKKYIVPYLASID